MPANQGAVPPFDSADLDELKQKLVTACHILDHEGVTDGYGHISARVPGTDAFLTIANVSPGCATVVGASIEQVVERATRLAMLGEWNHLALLHGEPKYLTSEELDVYNADQRFPLRGWEYFVSRLKSHK